MSYSELVRKNARESTILGVAPAFQKHEYVSEIAKRANEIRVAGDSDAQAFVKAITDDKIGRDLFRASKGAPGPDHLPKEDEAPPQMKFEDHGPAHRECEMLARDHQLRNPSKSMASSRAAVMDSRRDLSDRMKAEHMARMTGSKPLEAQESDASDEGEFEKVLKRVQSGPDVVISKGGYYKKRVNADGSVSYLWHDAA